jgi:outer membrane protein TolC
MILFNGRGTRLLRLLLCPAGLALVGCTALDLDPPIPEYMPTKSLPAVSPGPIRKASAILPSAMTAPEVKPLPPIRELTAEFVLEQTLLRNPTLAQMAAAVQAANARFLQVTSLDDPQFSSWVAPASLGSSKVNDSARFEISQKLPFPGKRSLRGDAAVAQAAAAGSDLEDTKLQLIESARMAFADYYLAARALEVNDEGLRLLDEFRRNAETRYKTGQSPQQDILQAEVETGRQTERRLTILRNSLVARARLNVLMNVPADSPLPPPPKGLARPEPIPDSAVLRDSALARRPDLRALKARIAADQAELAFAEREFYPDVEAMASYDSFWQAADDQQRLRAQVGIRMNLPVRLDRRRGAVAEASAQLAQRQAQLAQRMNQIGLDVEQAAAQARESEQALRLYEERILPAARENVKAAQSAYTTGKIPFVTLIEAQRNLIELRDRFYQAGADYHQRKATLERATGGTLTPVSAADGGQTTPRR